MNFLRCASRFASAFLLIAGVSIGPAFSSGLSHMVVTGKTLQPIGHYEYCQQYRSDCTIRTFGGQTEPVPLTRQRWREMVEVNVTTNNAVAPVTDMEAYDREEHWTYPVSYGDCEDYVLLKRKRLMELGWPASSLLITVVKRANGEGHAVLTVRTDRADYVLDNLSSKIVQWNHSSHTFIKRQSRKHSGKWMSIQDVRGKANLASTN